MDQLKAKQQQTIVALYERGWSKRRIARELHLDRLTVRRCLAAAAGAKSPGVQTGSEALIGQPQESKSPAQQTGSWDAGSSLRTRFAMGEN